MSSNYYRILGLDLGSKTLGIAKSDVMQILATGIGIFRFNEDDYQSALQYVVDFCKKDNTIKKIVLGLPKNMDNTIGSRAKIIINFKEQLEKLVDLEVILVDERRTTAMALDILAKNNTSAKKRKQVIDKQAAVIILQNYLDSRK